MAKIQCAQCTYFGLVEMIGSVKSHQFSSDIPCLRCRHRKIKKGHSEFVPAGKEITEQAWDALGKKTRRTGSTGKALGTMKKDKLHKITKLLSGLLPARWEDGEKRYNVFLPLASHTDGDPRKIPTLRIDIGPEQFKYIKENT